MREYCIATQLDRKLRDCDLGALSANPTID